MIRIKLTNRKYALIDDEDYDLINKYKWYSFQCRKNNYYVTASCKINNKWTTISMHRLVMDAKKGDMIDHKDGNGLNNQKYNLRNCNQSQNCANKKKIKKKLNKPLTSKYLGVHWHKGKNKWEASIRKNDKPYYLGNFKTQKEAAKAYDEAAKKLHKEFACLNFK